jgi:hypothetical protein
MPSDHQHLSRMFSLSQDVPATINSVVKDNPRGQLKLTAKLASANGGSDRVR